MKIFKFVEFAYLGIMFFFLYQAYLEWGIDDSKSILYICFAAVAVFMYFFKRKFRKKFDSNKKNN